MNLEDRLRSHMHSADDLFVETGRDAGAITAAGRRRNRRNQIGGAAAGGIVALGLVFGVASQVGDDGPEEFASQAAEAELAELPIDESAAISDTASAEDFGAEESSLAPDFIAHEVLVGVDDGFAGLRTSEVGIMAIRSDDGTTWDELPTNGIPEGAEITVLVYDEGIFAAPFAVFDELTAQTTSYIGTSTDLVNWTAVEVDLGGDFTDLFLGEIALVAGEVVAVAVVSPPFDEEQKQFPYQVIFTIRGTVGGPYAAEQLEETGFGASQLRSADGVAMFTVSTDTGANVWASSGGPWSVVRRPSPEDFPTLTSDSSSVFLVDSSGVERWNTALENWVDVDLPPVMAGRSSYANAASGGDTIGVLFGLVDAQGMTVGYVLAAGSGDELVEVPMGDLVPEGAFVSLVAVSADEALIEVFPEPEVFDEELAASGGLVEVEPDHDTVDGEAVPRYVRVPLSTS